MADLSFQATQLEFTRHIRNPRKFSAPAGIEGRRMKVYRDLFYNNFDSLISIGFPVLRSLYTNTGWYSLVRGFFEHHQCNTPYFLKIGEEFLRYLEVEHTPEEHSPPFVLELAHYEYMEIVLDTAEETIPRENIHPEGNLLEGVPIVSPLVCALSYRYPVHKISPDFQPQKPPDNPTRLLIYRNRNDQVKFMEVDHLTVLLTHIITEHSGITGEKAIEVTAKQYDMDCDSGFRRAAHRTLNHLRRTDIIVGTQL